ncbi:MAG: hypothetical protein PHH26_00420 [Candidatus Thermoplasmatota archaeon]|nr:hypothetical protein [Candidatus Thermoplasmatota archaeon]
MTALAVGNFFSQWLIIIGLIGAAIAILYGYSRGAKKGANPLLAVLCIAGIITAAYYLFSVFVPGNFLGFMLSANGGTFLQIWGYLICTFMALLYASIWVTAVVSRGKALT